MNSSFSVLHFSHSFSIQCKYMDLTAVKILRVIYLETCSLELSNDMVMWNEPAHSVRWMENAKYNLKQTFPAPCSIQSPALYQIPARFLIVAWVLFSEAFRLIILIISFLTVNSLSALRYLMQAGNILKVLAFVLRLSTCCVTHINNKY